MWPFVQVALKSYSLPGERIRSSICYLFMIWFQIFPLESKVLVHSLQTCSHTNQTMNGNMWLILLNSCCLIGRKQQTSFIPLCARFGRTGGKHTGAESQSQFSPAFGRPRRRQTAVGWNVIILSASSPPSSLPSLCAEGRKDSRCFLCCLFLIINDMYATETHSAFQHCCGVAAEADGAPNIWTECEELVTEFTLITVWPLKRVQTEVKHVLATAERSNLHSK